MTGSGVDPARLVIEALRLDRWSAAAVDERSSRALELGVGGFILFGGEAERVEGLTERLGSEAGRPLWIGADLERGAGQQVRGLSELPPPAALAAHPEPDAAAEIAGAITGEEALSVGINWVLAPVLDLDAERVNPIVATRSFGADPDLVARLGLRWIHACQRTGAMACAKHFPGHGRTRDDSHIGLPTVDAGARVLESDLGPFSAAAPTVSTVMVAHVAFPAHGSDGPATTSPSIVTGLLRQRLGFEGPISTDAMIMGAIGADDAGAAVEAVRAGCDLICYPSDAAATIAALRGAAEDESFAQRVEDAIGRSDRTLARYASGSTTAGAGPRRADRATDGRGSVPLDFETVDFARRTLVGDAGELAAWKTDLPTRVVGVSDDPDVGPPAGRAGPLGAILASELREAGWRVTEDEAGVTPQCVVVLAATPRGWKGRGGPSSDVIREAQSHVQTSERGLVVLLGHERWLGALGVPGICAWSTETVMERAAGRWMNDAVRGAEPAGGSAR